MRSQRPSLYWVAVFFLLAGALTAGDPWTWPLWLHRPWAHVVEALTIIIGGISTQVFRVWPPACFAVEALTLTQEFSSPIPNLSDQKSRRRSMGTMGERLILVWAAIVMGTSSVLHAWGVRHDPPFPLALADDSLSDELPWPDGETITVIRPPGRAAYWDPWHQHMVVGRQWDQSTWTRRHIVAHELAHAQQSSWRLRMADGWLKGVLTLSVLLATVLPPEAAWPFLAGGIAALGDAVARWPVEMQADRQAGQRLALTVSEGPARDTVSAWSVRLVRRHRILLVWETLAWASVVCLVTAGVFLLRRPGA